jgi:hypothetical protein
MTAPSPISLPATANSLATLSADKWEVKLILLLFYYKNIIK